MVLIMQTSNITVLNMLHAVLNFCKCMQIGFGNLYAIINILFVMPVLELPAHSMRF